ncbi:MAG: tRNA glutamyl-Q(34) synthetase GluQRS [Amphritea sp.]|nr:tRNA glutamyl-Q(34) synthetase GluQRS [Amphritea sp.]
MVYTGRFAPSPTGPLHFGSLLAALASYLDARAQQGRWLLRIEDLDPPREMPGACDRILHSLERFGLHWDDTAIWQSQRLPLYRDILEQLIAQGDSYYCQCSRTQLRKRSGSSLYDGYCFEHPPENNEGAAVRCRCPEDIPFTDRILGRQQFPALREDFVIFRRDSFFAYQLAVTVDDSAQNISHIVRGSDLLDSTPKQLRLQQLLGYEQPEYAHIPVASNAEGQKLSKQTFARALDDEKPVPQLVAALDFLGQQPPQDLLLSSVDECLKWAVSHWDINKIPPQTAIHWEERT